MTRPFLTQQSMFLSHRISNAFIPLKNVLSVLILIIRIPIPIHSRRHHARLNRRNVRQMPLQPLISMLMLRMATLDLLQAVSHQELVVPRCEDGGGDVDQDGDPGVAVVDAEDLAAPEDGCNDSGSEISGQVGGDAIGREAPNHCGVGHADGEWDGDWAHEGVGGVQGSPDYDADV